MVCPADPPAVPRAAALDHLSRGLALRRTPGGGKTHIHAKGSSGRVLPELRHDETMSFLRQPRPWGLLTRAALAHLHEDPQPAPNLVGAREGPIRSFSALGTEVLCLAN